MLFSVRRNLIISSGFIISGESAGPKRTPKLLCGKDAGCGSYVKRIIIMGRIMDEKEKRKEDIIQAGIAGATYETVQRFGSAVKEHVVAYSGKDYETGKNLVKGLKQISEEKVNLKYKNQNIRQQAGFSAEVKDVARTNADRIINKETTRRIRTDDLGSVNDPLIDLVDRDVNGNIIEGSRAQMKFYGSSDSGPHRLGNSERVLKKFQSKKFQKYLDADIDISVPSDQYDQLLQQADVEIAKLTQQLEHQKQVGNVKQAEHLQGRIDKLGKIKKNLRKSTLSSDEAVYARLHPKLSTVKDISKISHKAGVQSSKLAATIGGSVSIVRNLVSVCKGEIEPGDAVKQVAIDTGSAALSGYATGFVGSALKGVMQNSSKEYIRTLSQTNIAGTIVTVATTAAKTLKSYFSGEIDGVECLENLGEEGVGLVSSAMFTVVGQAVIPIPVVGGMIGSMVGYAIASASYGILLSSLKEAKLAKESRELTERVCEEHIKMIREYRLEMEKAINEYLIESMDVFRESFAGVKNALAIGDVDWVIDSSNRISETFGRKASFSSVDEFNDKMLSDDSFIL